MSKNQELANVQLTKLQGRERTAYRLQLAAIELGRARLAYEHLPKRLQRKVDHLQAVVIETRKAVENWPVTPDERYDAKARQAASKVTNGRLL